MANSTTQFGGFLTNVGTAQQANSAMLGLPWNITHMLIGDAGGEPSQAPDPVPKPTQTSLVRQVYRAQLNALYQSPADPAVLVAELVLPPETGGWWIRELALEDAAGNFVAVASPAPSYKPLLVQGSGRTQTIRMHVVFGNIANITLKVDPSIVLATRDYVDKAREAAELYARNQLKAHVDAANPHTQYLRRADVAKDSGPLTWLGAAAGTDNALLLSLKSSEATLDAYKAGQRFQFLASVANTGAVTAKVGNLAAVSVKKSGGSGVVDLSAGDLQAGVLYTLVHDGASFQVEGGLGGNSLPVGAILPFPVNAIPPGFMELDGSTKSAATYPDLSAYLGTAYNNGNEPAGYFRLPDYRGEFLRGWDHGRGVDAGREIGSSQVEALKSHRHEKLNVDVTGVKYGIGSGSASGGATGGFYVTVENTGLDAGYPGINTGAFGGSETRPRNMTVVWCIKAWNAPVNEGHIDVAALVEELAALNSSTPVGAIMSFPKTQVPAGFLELDGSVQSKTAYPDLYEYLGTAYNKGDEATGYFRLPDYRGEFLRGWDHGRGIDAGRTLGSSQLGQNEAHTHTYSRVPVFGNTSGTVGSGLVADNGTQAATAQYSNYLNASGGNEARPRNMAVMWCIKAWNTPVNQGQVDVAALIAELDALRSSTPVGAVTPFPKAQVPVGYLELDGSVQSSAAYPDLSAYLGTTYNKGDEPTGYFRLPDYRGEFLRGWDHGRGVDSGRTIGSWAADSLLDHYHTVLSAEAGTAKMPFEANVAGSATTNLGATGRATGSSVLMATLGSNVFAPAAAKGGTETRPRSLAVMWCIKAWSAPVNQGVADVAGLAPLAAQATETRLGTAKIATQSVTDAGADNTSFVTPKKLRFGLSMQLASNGYICLPSWLGGLVFQWGAAPCAASATTTTNFPIAFPNTCLAAVLTGYQNSGNQQAYATINGRTRTSFSWNGFLGTGGQVPNLASTAGAVQAWYFAVGN
ncbi:tail fiber protein [Pseudomonas sp. NPDC089401]|uniref:tail fiber protein n=1 Tax=Pseudomonas sp. NPDC089401 TaxID=3364462 RepID=UPI00380203DE